jgi:hypothetical protein
VAVVRSKEGFRAAPLPCQSKPRTTENSRAAYFSMSASANFPSKKGWDVGGVVLVPAAG